MRFFCKLVFAVALLTAVSGALSSVGAQGLTGQISGIVTDSGGGVLPGATVTVKNVGTNATRETVTGGDGSFVFPDLLAGKYDLTVTVSGFKTYEQKGIELGVDRARSDCARSRWRSAGSRRRSPSSPRPCRFRRRRPRAPG